MHVLFLNLWHLSIYRSVHLYSFIIMRFNYTKGFDPNESWFCLLVLDSLNQSQPNTFFVCLFLKYNKAKDYFQDRGTHESNMPRLCPGRKEPHKVSPGSGLPRATTLLGLCVSLRSGYDIKRAKPWLRMCWLLKLWSAVDVFQRLYPTTRYMLVKRTYLGFYDLF